MAAHIHTQTRTTGNRIVHPGIVAPAIAEHELRQALEITHTLQTSLEVDRIIELFSGIVQRVVPHEGIRYRSPELETDIAFGNNGRHTCRYDLVIGSSSFGELVIQRNRKFTSHDMELFEYLLCSLLYPLRNALLYREAVALSQKDPLTGINNRAALDEALQREIGLAKRHGYPLSLIILDIDHFKSVNDKFGHITGDAVIKGVVDCAKFCVRSTDMLFRYGGEEFVMLLRNTALDGAELLAERVREKVAAKRFSKNRLRFNLTVSGGVASLTKGKKLLNLFQLADQALYQAKQQGRNRVVAWAEPEASE